MPQVTIDGKQITVKAETTILEAARRAGVWIPTLCHSPVVAALATCRICMVEIDRGDGRKRMVTACNYPVRQDLVIDANGERATRARQGVMQLLLARCPESEELRQLARRMGVDGTPFPTVTENQRNCILCGLCVAVCEEVIGASAIGFAGRGVKRTVASPFRLPSEDCIACGACAAVCPVGTIQVRFHMETAEVEISPFKSRSKLRVCSECGSKMVAEPVVRKSEDLVGMSWDELKEKAQLCPACRRKHAAQAISFIDQKSEETPVDPRVTV